MFFSYKLVYGFLLVTTEKGKKIILELGVVGWRSLSFPVLQPWDRNGDILLVRSGGISR